MEEMFLLFLPQQKPQKEFDLLETVFWSKTF